MSRKTYVVNLVFIMNALLLLPAYSADGDGSGSDNSDLLRTSLNLNCFELIFCQPQNDFQNNSQSNNQNTYQNNIPNNTQPIILADDNIILAPDLGQFSGAAVEQILPTPATVYDYSLELKGAFQNDHNGERFEIIATPSVSVSHKNRNAQYNLGTSASLSKQLDGEFRLFDGNIDFGSNYILDRDTNASLSANLAATQASPNDPSLDSTIAIAPITVSGSADGVISRQFDRLTGELRTSIARTVFGESQLNTGIWQDNSVGNNTNLGAGLRLGYELTPIISIYVDSSYNRTNYDNDSLILAANQSNNYYQIGAGLSGSWRDVITAQAYIGYSFLQYDNAMLTDAHGTLFNASLGYISVTGVDFNANFSKTISAADPTIGASTRIEYTTSASASYQINDWLTARATIGAGWAHYIGIADIERSYNVGVGADYKINRQASLSADYSKNSLQTTALGNRQSDRFEVGITFSR